MLTKYVLGFAFDLPEEIAYGDMNTQVGLIRKVRPEWQSGYLNGIGGHIEEGETAHQAMVREFKEETGLFVPNWSGVTFMSNDYFNLVVFKAFNVPLNDMESLTDEVVGVYRVNDLPDDVIFNLRWLIPLSLDPQMYSSSVVCR